MLIQERLEESKNWSLKSGAHNRNDEGKACVMEVVAYVAGEEWSDTPVCACPVIGAFMRNWNDGLPSDAKRTELLGPFVPRLVGSKSNAAVELKRSYLALDWLVRVCTPAWLELAGLKEHADLCRQLGELHDEASCKLATETVEKARSASAAASAAARAAAWYAAWDAARAAARAAAWDAAWDAARAKISPTVEMLQASAVELVDKMLLLGESVGK
jgi:hypothetical protein